MNIFGIGEGSAYPTAGNGPKVKTPADIAVENKAESEAAVKEFLAFLQKSPAERMRDMWLKAHGLSEEELKSMPPERRELIEKQMAREIAEEIKNAKITNTLLTFEQVN